MARLNWKREEEEEEEAGWGVQRPANRSPPPRRASPAGSGALLAVPGPLTAPCSPPKGGSPGHPPLGAVGKGFLQRSQAALARVGWVLSAFCLPQAGSPEG